MDWEYVAKLKILKDRLLSWYVLLNAFMVAFIFIKSFTSPFLGLLILGIGIAVFAVVAIIDFYYILPVEQAYYWGINSEFTKLKEGYSHSKCDCSTCKIQKL